ncbi:MAG: hypothetical protein JSR59_20365 [Proteobacteria bacterium]|nr:hypothetical protein [Pseudomonadota bacterium]
MTLRLVSAAALAAFAGLPAHADWVTVSNSGAPLATCNPKVGTPPLQHQSPTLTTCKLTGLPGSAAIPGYILKAKAMTGAVEGVPITVNSVNVGTLYDRVYCKGTGTTCDTSNTYIIASRAYMNGTPSPKNTHCPTWSGATTQCFEINNIFRAIRGTNPTDIGYFMGTTAGSTNPDVALAYKYLEYAGKTYKGLNQITPPGNANYTNLVATGDRNATQIMFQSDTNVFDPDANGTTSKSSQWSPWLYARQVCPGGFNPVRQVFKVKYWEGGEEGQINQNIQASAYVCNP